METSLSYAKERKKKIIETARGDRVWSGHVFELPTTMCIASLHLYRRHRPNWAEGSHRESEMLHTSMYAPLFSFSQLLASHQVKQQKKTTKSSICTRRGRWLEAAGTE